MELGQPAVSLDVAGRAADRAMRSFTGLLRAGVVPTTKVSREWTVRDVAAHIAGFVPIYLQMARGKPSPVTSLDRLDEFNQRFLAVDEQNVYVFADLIDRGMAELLDAVAERGADGPVGWHGGLHLPLSTVLGLAGAEGYVHGHDVARAGRTRWEIPPDDAVAIFHAALPLFPSIVDRERARSMFGAVEVRLRGAADGRWVFSFAAGDLRIERWDGHQSDWTMSVAPAGYLLTAYGRMSPLKGLLTGQMIGWGRRPSLAFQFARAFRRF